MPKLLLVLLVLSMDWQQVWDIISDSSQTVNIKIVQILIDKLELCKVMY